MKLLNVPKIATDGRVWAQEVPSLLSRHAVPFETVECVDWEEYPYKPLMKFRIAHTGSSILVHYQVTEKSVRAVASEDNGRVWEDSCAEFFLQPDEADDFYYNIECNCAGTLLIGHGKPGDREHAPAEVMKTVDRWASLGRVPFEEQVGERSWELALVIPTSALFRDKIASLDGKDMRANFYKCGDLLQMPHFLSWNPIDLPKPCFHCPPFFGKVHFEG